MFANKKNLVPDLQGRSTVPSVADRRQKAKQNLQKKQQYMKQKFNADKKEARIYSLGDIVLWNNAFTNSETGINRKIDKVYAGPYKVTKVYRNDRYQIRSIKGMKGFKRFTAVVPADSMRPYKSSVSYDSDSGSDGEIVRQDLIDLLES